MTWGGLSEQDVTFPSYFPNSSSSGVTIFTPCRWSYFSFLVMGPQSVIHCDGEWGNVRGGREGKNRHIFNLAFSALLLILLFHHHQLNHSKHFLLPSFFCLILFLFGTSFSSYPFIHSSILFSISPFLRHILLELAFKIIIIIFYPSIHPSVFSTASPYKQVYFHPLFLSPSLHASIPFFNWLIDREQRGRMDPFKMEPHSKEHSPSPDPGHELLPRTFSTSALRIKARYSFWERLHSTPVGGRSPDPGSPGILGGWVSWLVVYRGNRPFKKVWHHHQQMYHTFFHESLLLLLI